MRKSKLAVLLMVVILALAGCRRENVGTNTDRYRKHKYDFADYIEITTVGVNGHGYLYIEPKEITRDMFENDEEFVKVKKDLDNMDLRYIPNERHNSNTLVISKTEELSNNETVSIAIKYKRDKLLSDMNTETYAYVVHDLPESSDDVYADLFSEDVVQFYGTKNNELFYHLNPDSKVYDLMAPLEYKIETNDEKLVKDGTLIDVSVSRSRKASDDVDSDLLLYFAKNGYVISGTEAELILDKIAEPLDPETMTDENYAEIEQLLKNEIAAYLEKGNIVIYSLQKSQKSIDEGDLYSYVVTFSNVSDGDTVYGSCTPVIHQVDGKFIVRPIDGTKGIKQEDVNSSTENTILHVFN